MRFTTRPRGIWRAGMALLLVAGLAACASQPSTHRGGHQAHGRSYEPPGPPGDPWGPYIRQAARRFDVPERWIREVMRQESGGRVHATSPVGAMGLMQVMPGTYRELQARYDLGQDPYHPLDSIMAGTAYIREMYDQFGSPAFLAAYNAGPRRLENFLYNRQGLPAETRNYVRRVGPGVLQASPVRRAPAETYAAAELPLEVPPGPRRMDSGTMMALREQRGIREQNAQFARLPDPEPAVTRVASAPLPPVPAARNGVVAMEPIADGSTWQGAAALAASEARGTAGGSLLVAPAMPAPTTSLAGEPRIGEERIVVASMEPIPDGSTPEGRAAMAASQARAQPARPAPFAAARPAARPDIPLPPRSLGFISPAAAATIPGAPVRTAATAAAPVRPAIVTQRASWAIQVGAFSTEAQARSAADAARAGGRIEVTPVRVGRGTLFRARVIGLSQPSAHQACDRMRGRGCMVLAPDQQG